MFNYSISTKPFPVHVGAQKEQRDKTAQGGILRPRHKSSALCLESPQTLDAKSQVPSAGLIKKIAKFQLFPPGSWRTFNHKIRLATWFRLPGFLRLFPRDIYKRNGMLERKCVVSGCSSFCPRSLLRQKTLQQQRRIWDSALTLSHSKNAPTTIFYRKDLELLMPLVVLFAHLHGALWEYAEPHFLDEGRLSCFVGLHTFYWISHKGQNLCWRWTQGKLTWKNFFKRIRSAHIDCSFW